MTQNVQQHWFIKIILTAALYYLSSLIGLELTSSTNSASFFTPQAGVALGALFLFGPSALIGIIGGALTSIYLTSNNDSLIFYISAFIPAIQAYASFKFFSAKLNVPSSFVIESDTVKFFTFAPLFSFISATLSILLFVLIEQIDINYIGSSFLTWWIGNAFGVLIATPLFLAIFSQHVDWQQRRISVGLTLIILMTTTIAIIQYAQNREHEEISQRLLQTNRTFNAEFENTLKQYEKNLQAINIFFLSTYHATPNEINDFLRKLNLKKNDNAYGYGWFGFADLVNTKKDSQYGFHTLKPYQFKLEQAPIRVIQDQFEECTIGSYLEIHQTVNKTYSLYRNIEASISSIENLCASEHLGGVAYADIDIDSLIKNIKQQLNLEHVDIQLIGTKHSQTMKIFDSAQDIVEVNTLFQPTAESLITYKNTFWQLKLIGNTQYVRLHANWNTWWLYLVSLLFTTVSAFGLLILTAKRLQSESIVDKKTEELQTTNDQLTKQIQQHQQQQILIKMQSSILEMIAKNEPLDAVLKQLCLYTENQIFEGSASINTYDKDKKTMSLAASPSLESENEEFFSTLSFNKQNPSVEAVRTQSQQIIEKIDESLSSELSNTQSYWATPIKSYNNDIIGVLSITLSSSRSPTSLEQQLMNVTASLASISIEQHTSSRQLNKLSNAVESSPNGIVITSLEGIIEYANPYFCQYIGVLKSDILGKYLSQFVQDANDSNKQEFDWDYSLSLGESQREYMGIKPNGDVYWCKQSIASLFDKHENSHHVLSIHQDITDEHTALKFIKQQASHDSLTGLYNQTEFEFQIDKLITQSTNEHSHTVAFLDLDNFTSINELCGYPAGDQLLRKMSQLIENQLRKTDFLARIGGDEFGIILEQCPAPKAKTILNGVIESIANYDFFWNETVLKIGASVGLVEISPSASDINKDELLKNADTACYLAKQEGRQQVHIYHDNALEKQIEYIKHNWLDTLNSALNNNHFILYAQPIVDVKTEQLTTYEILLRLRGENNEILTARSFTNDAERLNLMPKIDRWVLSNSFAWMMNNPSHKANFIIKLSGQTLDITFKPWLIQQIKKYHVDATKLCFTITEAFATANLKQTNDLIQSLKTLGCSFALEDFGCGLSSFNNLKMLSVDYIKIDGQLIKAIEHNIIDRAMVKSINEITHMTAKKTIADYTANETIKSIVSSLGVDFIQGSYVGEPIDLYNIKENGL